MKNVPLSSIPPEDLKRFTDAVARASEAASAWTQEMLTSMTGFAEGLAEALEEAARKLAEQRASEEPDERARKDQEEITEFDAYDDDDHFYGVDDAYPYD